MKRKLLKEILVYSVCTCMAFSAIPILAEDTVTSVASETGKGILANQVVPTDWSMINQSYLINADNKTVDIGSLTASSGANKLIEIPESVSNIAIKGDLAKTYNNLSIVVKARTSTLNLTIKDLKINGSGTGIDITGNTGTTNLFIQGENSIVSTSSNGIAVYTGNTLVIDADTNTSVLTIQAGTDSAGIGGRCYTGAGEIKKGNGKIIINSGTIDVTGGNNAAAIGSANDEVTNLEDITINGGIINAIGGNGGAGIGSGRKQSKSAGNIIINGGTINAVGKDGGAGIGGGAQNNGGKVFDIIITAGDIDAQGATGGAGIGGGANCHAGDITITGGTIRATGSDNAGGKGGAGIGGGSERGFKTIIIGEASPVDNNPFIEFAKGGKEAAGIGTGGQGQGTGDETIKLLDGIIGLAQGDGGAAGIGGGYQRGFKEIIIGNTQVKRAVSTGGGAGIGTGNGGSGNGNKIVIESPLYAGAADYNGNVINSIGGGYERDNHSTVVLKSEVFMSNDKVGVIDTANSLAGLKLYAFECYYADRVTRIGTGLNFSIRSNSDLSLALRPDNYSNGTIYSYLQDLGTNTLGQGTDYYMEIIDTATGKTYYAEEFARDTTNPNKTIIKMSFVEKKFANVVVSMSTTESSKIVPFSTSNIDFITKLQEDTSVPKPTPDIIIDGEAKIDFNKLPGDITPFDLSNINKIKFMVYDRNGFETDGVTPKYTYNASLTTALNGVVSTNVILDNVNKKMTIKYPNQLLNYGEYKIRILIPNTLNKQVNDYISQNVEAAVLADQNKQITATTAYTIKTHIQIDGQVRAKEQKGASTNNVGARYYYLIKIN